MGWVYVNEISNYDGKEVTLKGWLYNKRSSGKIWFLIFRDGTGFIQCVVSRSDTDEKTFQLYDELGQESSIIVHGIVHQDRRAPGGYEVIVKKIDVVQAVHDYPIALKEHGIDFLMDHRHLWLRSPKQVAILRIRHTVIKACRDFFDSHGFILADTPIFTPTACEGTTTLFETDYFGRKAYLTQSGQLYSEATAAALGKVYCFGPTFRAEKSKTRRHLTEFWMVEPEVAYYDLDDNMKLAEEFVSYVVQTVLKERKKELEVLERDISLLEKVEPPFPRITYSEAVEILKENGIDFEWGNDFGGADETVISNQFEKPVMIHRFPAKVKAFYMKRDPENEELALGVDVLAPEGYGEIIGGGQREENYEILRKRIKEFGLSEEVFKWYLDLRKFGSVPHSGFGMGVERAVAWICGLKHIRETIPFPRTIYRLEP
ncbi:MAG: asparagine--tRNA ligase [Candidatus Neomarinimicrobiota bacterium]|nr:MAG: asparagine--tRNA ligase [Candidatus Neomarinimicrobiota bacterium]